MTLVLAIVGTWLVFALVAVWVFGAICAIDREFTEDRE